MVESGVPGFVSMSFTGLLAPAGVPSDAIKLLNSVVNEGIKSPDMAATLDKLGVVPKPGSPEDFAAFILRENRLWASVAKRAGIRIEN
jgi:tripartite-type tricarboxylate transporter receptor subunit TctC